MIPHVAAFVDAGYLRRGCERCLGLPAGTARIDARALVEWLGDLAETLPALHGHRMLRTYWYDGALAPGHPQYQRQQTYFGALADTPGRRLRLGHMQPRAQAWQPAVRAAVLRCGVRPEEFERHFTFRASHQQKGVDTLLVLDLVRLAQTNAYDTAVLVTGDRDLAEAVRAAQDHGRRVILVHPARAGAATELRRLADQVVVVERAQIELIARSRVGGPGWSAGGGDVPAAASGFPCAGSRLEAAAPPSASERGPGSTLDAGVE
jgi:uncharacterized LabA/DUF88 family protein